MAGRGKAKVQGRGHLIGIRLSADDLVMLDDMVAVLRKETNIDVTRQQVLLAGLRLLAKEKGFL